MNQFRGGFTSYRKSLHFGKLVASVTVASKTNAPASRDVRGVFIPMSKHHHLYNRAAWRRLREAQLRQQPFCRMHQQLGAVVAASVVDHIKAHRGDEALFFDGENLQSLCKPCHDAHKQAQEHSVDGVLRGAGHDGRPLDLAHPWHQAPTSAVGVAQGGLQSLRQADPRPPGTRHSQRREMEGGAYCLPEQA